MKADPSPPGGRDSGGHHRAPAGGAHRVEVTVSSGSQVAPHKARAGKLYLLRDAGDPDGPVLTFTAAEWEAFVLGVKDGEFDLP